MSVSQGRMCITLKPTTGYNRLQPHVHHVHHVPAIRDGSLIQTFRSIPSSSLLETLWSSTVPMAPWNPNTLKPFLQEPFLRHFERFYSFQSNLACPFSQGLIGQVPGSRNTDHIRLHGFQMISDDFRWFQMISDEFRWFQSFWQHVMQSQFFERLESVSKYEVLIQLLAARGFLVYAVVRKHSGEDWIKQKLHGLGAAHVFLSSEDIRGRLEELERALPQLALDGVGGAATNQLVQALAKTGDLVCFGVAGGSNQQAVTLATGKKWKGSLLQFSFDEWLNRDVATNSRILNDMLLEVTELVKQKKMQFVIKEYTTERFNMAVLNAKQIGRTHAVVLHLPRLQENPSRNAEGQALAVPETSLEKDHVSRHNRSWDLDFLQWEDTNADEEIEWRIQKEKNLFQKVPHPAGAIQKFVEAPPTAIAQELGCSAEKAEAVLFWLPGRGEIPQEHAHWLETLCVNRELRVLILEPHQLEQDLKWQLGPKRCNPKDHQNSSKLIKYPQITHQTHQNTNPFWSFCISPVLKAMEIRYDMRLGCNIDGDFAQFLQRCSLEWTRVVSFIQAVSGQTMMPCRFDSNL